jgi:lipoprotein NlpI
LRHQAALASVILVGALAWSLPSSAQTQGQAVQNAAAAVDREADGETARKLAIADRAGDGDALLMLATAWIARDAAAADAYYWRGRERFRRGQVAQSVQDFDRYIELRPEREPPQWERGIALYYDGQFARGAKQFELYQTFDNRDVENSVWRYLCLACAENRDKARATMLPVDRDPRVPMTEIFQLFAGKATPEQVLAAARANDPPADVLAGRLFYAHLYLALFYESEGQTERCRQYLMLAADKELRRNPRINPYMWAVADVHWKRLNTAPR